ncbi:C4-dicarboxylate ABC transporter permease [Acuticoccus sediminis]|uniref:TRAP transporter small permease protein n=1 Tax=Acuticoccus sediminis TaxID=2184697 RepID=A0A8B2NVG5_9HYPH|nr:TRAP transporter small permease subunit [Acuticoccus sediminis]RAI02489.1 C4-dicarboxylate ABC transporter permease [Acuticoccus sediminis]
MPSRLSHFLHRLEAAAAIGLLIAIVLLVAAASLARAAGSPIIWSIEIAQLLFVWLCVLSADLALQESRHFGLALLAEALGEKGYRRVEMFNLAVLSALLAFLLVYAVRNAALMHPRLFGATQMHGSYTHASMVLGFALMLRTTLARLYGVARGKVPALPIASESVS